jgi:hypothetical protein
VIEWGVRNAILSARDHENPRLADLPAEFLAR